MIAIHQEAQFLYSTCEAKQREQAIALHIAQAVLQQAQNNCQYVQTKLTKAEFHLGRAGYMIKKGGFSNVLGQMSRLRHQPVVKVHCMHILHTILFDPPHNHT